MRYTPPTFLSTWHACCSRLFTWPIESTGIYDRLTNSLNICKNLERWVFPCMRYMPPCFTTCMLWPIIWVI
jgi:hypothetical protein